MDRRRRSALGLSILVAGYAALMAVIVFSMLSARRWALAELSTPASVAQWEAWRSDVREQQGSSPVSRRVPKSNEPPRLVLMRDHFTVMMVGAILFSTVLYWIIAWLVAGMLRTPASKANQ